MKSIALAFGLSSLALIGFVDTGKAAERRAAVVAGTDAAHKPTSARYYRQRAPQARHFAGRRIGFYSYSYRDVIDTYGLSRSKYGSINTYRDPSVDLQTPSGPFDHGFFFDSGIGPHGGNSPYLR